VAKYPHIHTKIRTKKPKIQNQKFKNKQNYKDKKTQEEERRKQKKNKKGFQEEGGKEKRYPLSVFNKNSTLKEKRWGGQGLGG